MKSNSNIELSFIATLLDNPGAYARVMPIVKENDLSDKDCKTIYRMMAELYEKEGTFNWVTIFDKAAKEHYDKRLSEIAEYLTKYSTTSLNIENIAKVIITNSVDREFNNLLIKYKNSSDELQEKMIELSRDINRLQERFNLSSVVPIEIGVEEVSRLAAMIQSGKRPNKLNFGFRVIDKITGGIENDDLIVISGEEKSGKSTMAIQVALHNAIKNNARILIFSQEMSLRKLTLRMAIIDSQVNWLRALEGIMEEDEWHRFGVSLAKIARLKIYVNDHNNNIDTILANMETMNDRIDLVIVDYLQIIDTANKDYNTREREVAYISGKLKTASKKFNKPIIVVSAVNEQGRARESRAIEYDMDKLIRIEKDDVNVDELTGIVKTNIVIRQRMGISGETGDIKLGYLLKTGSWVNLDYEEKNS